MQTYYKQEEKNVYPSAQYANDSDSLLLKRCKFLESLEPPESDIGYVKPMIAQLQIELRKQRQRKEARDFDSLFISLLGGEEVLTKRNDRS